MPNLRTIKHFVDASSQGITMYRGILYGLAAIIAVGEVLALTNVIGISAIGLLLMTLVVTAASYVTSKLFAALWRVPVNTESWLISALIIACILAPSTKPSQLAVAALAGAIAVASKYLIAWRGSALLNPAAVGAFVVSVTNLAPAIWWVATPAMLFVTIPVALITLYKHHKYQMFSVFFAAAFIVLLIINAQTQHDSFITVLGLAITSWPLIFLGSVMLTEPTTMPPARYLQLFYALLVGALTTAQLQYGPVQTSPLLALLIGNIFVAFVMPPWAARLRLLDQRVLADGIHEFTFNKPKTMDFQAGQYVDVTVGHSKVDNRGNRRRFSIASAPDEKELRIATRVTEGKTSSFKKALLALDVDDQVRVANVRGEFTLPKGNSKLLFIAGGIGITPFRSMIAALVHAKQTRDIVLLYSSSSKTFVYKELLKQAQKFGIVTLLTDKRLQADELQTLVADYKDRLVYISGPDAMVTNYREMLIDSGLSRQKIHTDHFSGY